MEFDYTDAVFATSLIRAIVNCKVEDVEKALSRGFSANLPDNRGWTPIHEAAVSESRADCLRKLVAHSSADINAKTFQGETPLFIACESGNIEAIKIILTQPKCNVNLPNNEGVTPLHTACANGNFKVVKMLIGFGCKVNCQDFNGYSPLHETVSFCKSCRGEREATTLEICKFLLKHQANPDVLEYEGNYPFHFACQNGLLKCVELLFAVSKQRDVINFCNNDGRTPLMMAVQSKNIAVIETLLLNAANADIADKKNITALHLAAHSANFDIFSLIKKATSNECMLKYCTFNEERDFENILQSKRINSIICLAIDTDDLEFLNQILDSDCDSSVLTCPTIHAENLVKKSFTLHTPISFLLESKMYDLGDRTLDFLQTLIDHKSPIKVSSKNTMINYINPVCAGLVALNDCQAQLVMKCLRLLLHHGADPDEPHGRMPYAMEQAIMRGSPEAVLLLLQYSNTVEPEEVINWIANETSTNQYKFLEALLPIAPYFKLTDQLIYQFVSDPSKKILFSPKVHSLTSYCRAVIRKQLHEETKTLPTSFRDQLLNLVLPKDLYYFLSYM